MADGRCLNKNEVRIQRLEEHHLGGILGLMNREGWYYYDHHELRRYLTHNQTCFTLIRDGQVLGSIFTTDYGSQAWIGNIIVAEQERGKGLAAKMIRTVMDALSRDRQVDTFRLGSVPLAIGLYKRAGFLAEAFTTAQVADLPLEVSAAAPDPGKEVRIRPLEADDLEVVAALDARYFKSNRLGVLTEIFQDSVRGACWCLEDRDGMAGFLMIRRRQASKHGGGFAEGPDYVYRLGPCAVVPAYGITGFKALFQKAILPVNAEVRALGGSAKMYAVFPKNADKEEIFDETRALATQMGLDADMDMEQVFDRHDHLFGAPKSRKNEEQGRYMKALGFYQEYFEQVMCCTDAAREKAAKTRADTEGIFATATPGDKA